MNTILLILSLRSTSWLTDTYLIKNLANTNFFQSCKNSASLFSFTSVFFQFTQSRNVFISCRLELGQILKGHSGFQGLADLFLSVPDVPIRDGPECAGDVVDSLAVPLAVVVEACKNGANCIFRQSMKTAVSVLLQCGNWTVCY